MGRFTFILMVAILSGVLTLTFTIITSKMKGPRLFMYDSWISYDSLSKLQSHNTSYILLPGKRGEAYLDSMDQGTGNGIWVRDLDTTAFNMVPVIVIMFYCVYTYFKTEHSTQGVSKINDDDEYSQEIIQEHSAWHMLYIVSMILVHIVLITYLCNPVELVVAVFLSHMITLQTETLIMSRGSEEPTTLNSFGRIFSGSAVMLSWAFVYSQLRDFEGIAVPFVLLLMTEVFMILGHTGRELKMGAVMECRSLYMLANGIFIVGRYTGLGSKR